MKNASELSQVLGTVFNVTAYRGEPAVTTLVSGSVEVSTARQRVRLQPGEQARTEPADGRLEVCRVNPELYTSWVRGVFRFKDTRLEQVEAFDPYRRVEAETMAWGYGLKTSKFSDGKGVYVHSIDDGDSLRLRGVDFGRRGAKRFTACVASAKGGCSIEIHLDHAGGPLVGTLQVEPTGGQDSYREMACEVSGAKKTHDLVFVFRGAGKDLMQWDWWRFE